MAIRERYEETGIRVVVGDRLPMPAGWISATNAVFLAEAMDSQVPAPPVDLTAERFRRKTRWRSIDHEHPLGPLDPRTSRRNSTARSVLARP